MWTRFLPHIDVLRQLLADGALGDLTSVLADHGQYIVPDRAHRVFAPELAGGAMLDLASIRSPSLDGAGHADHRHGSRGEGLP